MKTTKLEKLTALLSDKFYTMVFATDYASNFYTTAILGIVTKNEGKLDYADLYNAAQRTCLDVEVCGTSRHQYLDVETKTLKSEVTVVTSVPCGDHKSRTFDIVLDTDLDIMGMEYDDLHLAIEVAVANAAFNILAKKLAKEEKEKAEANKSETTTASLVKEDLEQVVEEFRSRLHDGKLKLTATVKLPSGTEVSFVLADNGFE